MQQSRLKILMVAAEAAPFQQTGDVARVITGLSVELRRQGHDVRLIMPLYRNITLESNLQKVVEGLDVRLGSHTRQARILRLDFLTNNTTLPVYFVENDFYFGRELPYGYLDDYERFIFLSRAVMALLASADSHLKGWIPDLVHCHDWTAGLLPVFLRSVQINPPQPAPIASLYTVHNAAFEGIYSSRARRLAEMESLGIYSELSETSDRINFMARGILTADAVNTVSPHYAEDIRQGREARTLHSALKLRGAEIAGILNGIDKTSFDPESDSALPNRFDEHELGKRKLNKAALQSVLGLDVSSDKPLLAFVSRLMPDKGISLLEQIIPDLLEDGAQIVVAGAAGDPHYRRVFSELAARLPGQVAAPIELSDVLGRQIYGAADIVMVPSLLEPCGLQQMLAMRYGAIPVVRETGGLADTISQWTVDTELGKGFVFGEASSLEFLKALKSALEMFHSDPPLWMELQQHNMGVDLSWKRSAKEYVELYRTAIEASRSRAPLPIGDQVRDEPRDLLVDAILEIAELSTATESQEFVSQVARNMRDLLQSDAVLIWLRDETDPHKMYLAEYILADGHNTALEANEHPLQAGYLEPDSRAWHHQYKRESLNVDPYAQMGFLGSELAKEQGWMLQLTAPIYTPGTMLGRADVFFTDANHPYSGREVDMLGALGRTLADNLQKKREVQQQECLLAAYREMVHAQTLREVAGIVLKQARDLTHSTEACIRLRGGYQEKLGDSNIFNDASLPVMESWQPLAEQDAAGNGTAGHAEQTNPRWSPRQAVIWVATRAADNEPIGEIGVARDSARMFNQDDEAILKRLASHAADVLQAARRREQQDQKHVDELRRLSAILVEGGDFQNLLDRVVKTTAEVLQAQGASLYLLNEQNLLEIRAAAGYHESLLEHHKLEHDVLYRIGEGITGGIAERQTYFKADSLKDLHIDGWKGKHRNLQNDREPNAFLGIPLLITDRSTQEDRVIGVLKFEDRRVDSTPIFTNEDVRLGEMMSNVIATVVHNVQTTDRRLNDLSSNLKRLSGALASGQDKKVLMGNIVNTIAQVLDVEAATLYLLDEASNRLVIRAAYGYQAPLLEKNASYAWGEGVTGRIAQDNKSVLANSLEELRGIGGKAQGKFDYLQGDQGPAAFYGLPLNVQGRSKPIGVLKVESLRERIFTSEDVLLITMMANVISTVIYNTGQGEARIGHILKRLGTLATPANAGPELLAEFARSEDMGIVDQFASAVASMLNPEPESTRFRRAKSEIEALARAKANPEIFGRVVRWIEHEDLKWLFSLFYTILKFHVKEGNWNHAIELADPWIQLYEGLNDDTKFGAAVHYFTQRVASAIRVDVIKDYTQHPVWCSAVLNTVKIFGVEIECIPLLFQRHGRLDDDSVAWMQNFANHGLDDSVKTGKPYKVLLLVLWNSTVLDEQLKQMREQLRTHDISLVVATNQDILRVLDSGNPTESLRGLVLRQVTIRSPWVIAGAVPDAMFFGRDEQLGTIIDYVSAGQSCAVIGGRRIGKTSVLLRLSRTSLPAAGFRALYLDGATLQGYDGFIASAKRALHPNWPANGSYTIEELFDVSSAPNPVVLLLDEADPLVNEDRKCGWPLFNALRALTNYGLSRVIVAGERTLRGALHRDATGPLHNFANEILLGPLDRASVEVLVTKPMEQIGISLVDKAAILSRIYDFTSGHPNVVQRLCDRLKKHLDDQKKRYITLGDIDSVINNPSFIRVDFLETYFARASTLEIICALLMSLDSTLRSLGSVHVELTRNDVPATLGQTDGALERLVDLRSILEHTTDGYEFAARSIPLVMSRSERVRDWIALQREIFLQAGDIPPETAPLNLQGRLW